MSVLGNNLLAQYYAQNQGLPDGYEAVEYLESTRTQYIDSTAMLSSSHRVVCSWMPISNINGGSVYSFGFLKSLECIGLNLSANGNFYALWKENTAINISYSDGLNKKYLIDISSTGIYINNVKKYTPSGSFVCTGPAYLFWCNGTSQHIGVSRIYMCIMYNENNVLMRNFIPCVRKSDNKPGLYDLCRSICPLTNTPFYINAGTGEFVTP